MQYKKVSYTKVVNKLLKMTKMYEKELVLSDIIKWYEEEFNLILDTHRIAQMIDKRGHLRYEKEYYNDVEGNKIYKQYEIITI